MVSNNYATQCVFGSRNWFNVGKILYLIFKGSDIGYELWLTYSKFSPKFEEKRCCELWSDFDELMPEDFVKE